MVPCYYGSTLCQVFDFSNCARAVLKIFQILNFINCPGAGKLEGAGAEKLEFQKAGFHKSWTAAGNYLTESWNCDIIKWENIFYIYPKIRGESQKIFSENGKIF